MELSVDISSDEDGYTGRECPADVKFFRCKNEKVIVDEKRK